ncbi:MAG TPA: ABC transporter ATP-binding protein [Aggregatilineales bacterium]|nr:ABC transporter ATP-binding protein [Aggregatilineales bacterium]HPV05738.1 ABC transporter ATP-binding protein [Aggregatilineales bacterium]HQA66892.1 ABC transporter ATP-binding protein [Aggregatilineales bacterium]HQE17347.1 ABC transporter ATP-binding protein [Aggregatilineales bacterium]
MSAQNQSQREIVIEARGLRRSFGKTVAVDNLDMTVYRGEIFGLVGPDGAGKTTTLRLLAAILDPDEGTATVAGYDTRRDPEAIKARIGYMSQSFGLYGDLSVEENINFFADVFGVSGEERKERIERLLGFSRLGPFRKRRAGRLSGGMQKKLGLACTLIHQPQILFLDEPTTGVDPVSRREFWDILTSLHVEGVSIVVSTPYMDEAERCSRIGLMVDGQLIEVGTPDEIRRRVPGKVIQILPDDRLRARALLRATPEVHEVQSYGELLHVFVDDIEAGQALIRRVLGEAGIEIALMRPVEPRVEEAFISLIRRREAAHHD